WVLIAILILDNWGVNVGTLLAGLGVTGVAIALATQNILSDLFASVSIIFDKPFVVGDFIVVDNYMGSIEKIGLKTTRLRSLSGEQLIFSNNDLLKSRIRNYQRMTQRRIEFSFGLAYETPVDKLRMIPNLIREIIVTQKMVRFDRAHFKGFGDSSLNF